MRRFRATARRCCGRACSRPRLLGGRVRTLYLANARSASVSGRSAQHDTFLEAGGCSSKCQCVSLGCRPLILRPDSQRDDPKADEICERNESDHRPEWRESDPAQNAADRVEDQRYESNEDDPVPNGPIAHDHVVAFHPMIMSLPSIMTPSLLLRLIPANRGCSCRLSPRLRNSDTHTSG